MATFSFLKLLITGKIITKHELLKRENFKLTILKIKAAQIYKLIIDYYLLGKFSVSNDPIVLLEQ